MTLSKAILLSALLSAGSAFGHDSPMGWTYGFECCSSIDCRQLHDVDVTEGPEGYRIVRTGELIPYGDKRIKQSKDEFFHQCTPGGSIDADKSICLYVPNRGF
jgi:hypothetical protein